MNFQFLVVLLILPHVNLNPTGCTYDASTILYTCSARLWALPLTFTDFPVQPQRLLLKDVSGELPATAPSGPTFSGFNAINTASFDARYSPSLTIMCYVNGILIITKDAFSDLGWVEEMSIIDCDIASLPTAVFEHIGNVNSFTIEGGSISNMVAESFKGLNVQKIASAPTPKGEFIIRNSKMTSGQLASGALFMTNNASTVVLDNLSLTSISKTVFSGVPNLQTISLSSNSVSSLGNNLFSALSKLSNVNVWSTNWHCSCENLWFISYTKKNNITLDGDIICASPSSYEGKRAASFYQAECENYSPCDGKLGIVIGDKCVKGLDLFQLIISFFSTVFSFTAFGTIIIIMCKEKKEENKIQAVMKIRTVMAGKIVLKLNQEIERMKTYIEDLKDNYSDDLWKSRVFKKEEFNEDIELKPCESDDSDEYDPNWEHEDKIENIKSGMLDEIMKDNVSCNTDETSVDDEDDDDEYITETCIDINKEYDIRNIKLPDDLEEEIDDDDRTDDEAANDEYDSDSLSDFSETDYNNTCYV